MKSAIFLIVILVCAYLALHLAGAQRRSQLWAAVRPHAAPILAIVVCVLLALVVMFRLNAVSIL